MKFNYDFLKKYVALSLKPEELGDRLTMAGAQLASLTKIGDDAVFEIEITSNRPDLLSIAGLSYEVAGMVNQVSRIELKTIKKPTTNKSVRITLKDKNDCPFYRAILLTNVRVAQTPQDMKTTLEKCGFLSINNVVDITNYCMLKWGHPLHAFDWDTVQRGIIVRRAVSGEKILCIDNKERILDPQAIVIADEQKILALAGIIGGKQTEITGQTKNVLLEAALFPKGGIRPTRRKIGISTESSYRFERDITSRYLFAAQDEAADLLVEHAGGSIACIAEQGKSELPLKRRITVSLDTINGYLGTAIDARTIKKLLRHTQCEIKTGKRNSFRVIPPFFRRDIQRDVDVYEEIARGYCYENIPLRLPEFALTNKEDTSDTFSFKNKLRVFLRGQQLREIITYSFLHDDKLAGVSRREDLVEIVNPLKKDERFLRNTLWLTAADVIKHNIQNNAEDIAFFEIGNVFFRAGKAHREETRLGIFMAEDERHSIYTVKSVVENLCLVFCGVKPQSIQESRPFFAESLSIISQNEKIGFVGMLDEEIGKRLGIEKRLFVADLSVAALRDLYGVRRTYKPFSRYPEIVRDISLALKKPATFEFVQKKIEQNSAAILKHVFVADVYTGDKLEKSYRGYTVRCVYQSDTKTLSSEEVDVSHEQVRKALAQDPQVILR